MSKLITTPSQPTYPVSPLDTVAIVKNGDSPTAIILSVAILLAILVPAITGLVQVILKQQK